MEIYEMADEVKSPEDLIKFINQLRMDLQINKGEWKNITLEDYLEALEACFNEMDEYNLYDTPILSEQPSWKIIALTLFAASIYE
ncbi:hypothetical protein MHI39_18915 [Heyndrickxia sp. FSL K6-6286]|uniref:DUF7660 family protein n=1 Tax=Heyndrickxia sp. FSL K6-6286 TaxID=2921510 RepID=UPI00315AB950